MSDDVAHAFAKLIEAALGLPEVEQATSYGMPALKVRKKLLCRVKDADTSVVMCPVEEKELLMEAAPALYFQTDHYKNWPSMLIRIRAISRAELRKLLERAFLMRVPRTLARKWSGS